MIHNIVKKSKIILFSCKIHKFLHNQIKFRINLNINYNKLNKYNRINHNNN